jgi:hypothetical protein
MLPLSWRSRRAQASAAATPSPATPSPAAQGASTPLLAVATQDLLTALGTFWGTTLNARLMTKPARGH